MREKTRITELLKYGRITEALHSFMAKNIDIWCSVNC